MNMTPAAHLAIALFLALSALWLLSLRLRDSSIIDIFWGLGFVLAQAIYLAEAPRRPPPLLLLTALVTLWGLRLSLYLLWRNWGRGEDFRYRKMRAAAGRQWWWRSYLMVFVLQGVLIWVISLPLLVAAQPAAELSWIHGLAMAIWALGFFFETVGDLQLARFRADPSRRGQVLDSGVWRYSRHPNYFGDAAQWWAFYLFAAKAGGYWTILSPLLMTVLLLRVSGVVLLEKTLVKTKPAYADYIERTSAFIPWPWPPS